LGEGVGDGKVGKDEVLVEGAGEALIEGTHEDECEILAVAVVDGSTGNEDVDAEMEAAGVEDSEGAGVLLSDGAHEDE